ncbi:MAG: cytochrome P450 [Pseudomonadota bacterium]
MTSLLATLRDYKGFADIRPAPPAKDRTIPRDPGLPLLGYTLDFLRDPLALSERLYRRNGDIVRTRMVQEVVMMYGPEANQFVLQNTDQQFSSEWGWWYHLHRVFPDNVMMMDGDHHWFQRKLMAHAFKKPQLVDYLARMNPEIRRGIAGFPTGERVLMFPQVKKLTLDLGARIFMGAELGAAADQVNRDFLTIVEAATAIVRDPVPGTLMARGVRARRRLEDYFFGLIAEKRRQPGADFFSQFCVAETEDGGRFTDRQIVDHMIFLMMAAHDTTTSTLTTMVYALGKDQAWQERLRESSRAFPGDELEFDQLQQLTEHEWAMNEALRMYPPLTSMPRGVAKDCEFRGYRLYRGELVGISPILTHYLPEYWSNPHAYDPERFSPARAEQKKNFFQFIPFGGGHHTCLGQHFAVIQVKALMHQLLRNYRWSVPRDYRIPYQLVPIVKPKDDLPLNLQRLR